MHEDPSAVPVKRVRLSTAAMTCTQHDRQGVLTCSAMHDLCLYQCIIDTNPRAIHATDKFGLTSLEYGMLTQALLKELIHFFFKVHKSKWNSLPFDFTKTIIFLAKCNQSHFGQSGAECISGSEEVLPESRYLLV